MLRFSRIITNLDGYLMRFEVDISHELTREHLKGLLRSFLSSVIEFTTFVEGPKTSPLS